MRNLFAIWRIRRLKVLNKENEALEKQIGLQAELNELLKEEDEIHQASNESDR